MQSRTDVLVKPHGKRAKAKEQHTVWYVIPTPSHYDTPTHRHSDSPLLRHSDTPLDREFPESRFRSRS